MLSSAFNLLFVHRWYCFKSILTVLVRSLTYCII